VLPVTAFRAVTWQSGSASRNKAQLLEAHMATLYFHCAGTQEVLLDRRGSEVEDIFDARARAYQIIQSIIRTAGPEDWRDWNVHVSDNDGEELFLVPFSLVLGKPH